MKITIAIALALLTIGVNATINPTYEEIQPFVSDRGIGEVQPFETATGRQSWIVFVNRMRKEIKELIEEYNQCNAYESDALKGTCFTHWSIRLVTDIKQFVEAIKNWSDDIALDSHDSNTMRINEIKMRVQTIINEYNQCDSYENEDLKEACLTNWSVHIANAIIQLEESIGGSSEAYSLPQSRGKSDAIILANNVRKEAKQLSDQYNQCLSYKSDIKKGKCLINWAKVAVNDIFKLTKAVLKLATPCKQRGTGMEITKDVVCTILLVTTDVKELIDLFNECSSQLTDVRKGFCFTRFALTILADAYELVITIIGFFQPGSPDFLLLGYEAPVQDYSKIDN